MAGVQFRVPTTSQRSALSAYWLESVPGEYQPIVFEIEEADDETLLIKRAWDLAGKTEQSKKLRSAEEKCNSVLYAIPRAWALIMKYLEDFRISTQVADAMGS